MIIYFLNNTGSSVAHGNVEMKLKLNQNIKIITKSVDLGDASPMANFPSMAQKHFIQPWGHLH